MFCYGTQGNMTCPLLEGITVDTEAVVAGKGHKVCILPRTIYQPRPLFDGDGLLF